MKIYQTNETINNRYIDPYDAKAWNNKGKAYDKLGDTDRAKECRDIAKKISEGVKTQYGK
jgi:tetratricopeptide (TPR) repeat protein